MGSSVGTRRVALLLTAVLAGAVLVASPAGAAVLVVGPGESIQAAVDAAAPGSVIRVSPGTYAQSVVISKDGITLLGSGPSATRLVPPADPNPACFGGTVSGICVLGVVDAALQVVDPAEGVRVIGFTVSGFPATGIRVRAARGTVVYNNVVVDNLTGIFESLSTGGRYVANTVSSGIDGISVQGTTGTAIHGNTIFDNTDGVVVTASAGGQITSNNLHDNCEGILLLFGGATQWVVSANTVNHNTKACPPTATSPPVSGLGIAIVGAHANVVQGNRVFDNQPSGPTIASGGIVLDTFLGQPPPANNKIVSNIAHNNLPADIVVNQMGPGNVFVGNDCDTSIPPGLCA